ncbi:MAG: SAM-dependent methyltransferase [Nitrospiraceae bacterium]|nr:MAG: SAM-dependent methyltransferase [Nitrospiraceae bacterium]
MNMQISQERKTQLKKRAEIDYEVFNNVRRCMVKHFGRIEGKRLIDIGCGRTFPQPLLFNTFGSSMAAGIDITTFVDNKNLSDEDKYYYQELGKVTGKPLKFTGLSIENINAAAMPFPDNSFDFVISNAAFEHFENVEAVVAEIRRVMKKGAIGHIGIHLYTSLSGSHHPAFQKEPLTEIPQGVAPWYHLRGMEGYRDTPLNKWREFQYKELFGDNFEILQWIVPEFEEGKQFLTGEIRKELRDYTRDELLRRWCVAIIRNGKG